MSAPTPGFGAPSLGPADRNPRLVTPPDTSPGRPAWDDPAPAAWRAFGEPAPTPKEDRVSYDPNHVGNYNHRRKPEPKPQPTPQPAPEQKPEATK